MILNEHQLDGLSEVLNIAFSRTAAALSDLTGQRVLLDLPQVAVYDIEEMSGVLGGMVQGEVATVHQVFQGPVSGNALLLLNHDRALALIGLLTEDEAVPVRLDASAREVLTEVGNILLNACLGTFSNILHLHVTFSVPRVSLEAIDALLESLTEGDEAGHYALMVRTNFRLGGSAVSGYLLIVLSVASLDRLLQLIDEMV